MSYVLFISEEKLKNSTAIGGSVDMDFILPYLKTAQRIYLEPKLGTDLFEALQTKITAGSLTGTYKTLVEDYLMDTLVHYAFYQSLPFLRAIYPYCILKKMYIYGAITYLMERGKAKTQQERSDLVNMIYRGQT